MDESIFPESKAAAPQKPPLTLSRIAAELLAGMGMSLAAMMVVRCAESIMLLGRIGEGEIRIVWTAMYSKVTPAVYGIAAAIGVYLLGSRGRQTGSFLVTLACGVLAGLLKPAIVPLAGLLEGMLTFILFVSSALLELVVPPLAATIGFNLTRRYKQPVVPQRRAMGESIDVEKEKHAHPKPPRNLGRIACEILTGAATAAALAYSSLYVVGYSAKIAGLGEGCMDGLFIGAMMSYVALLVYIVGSAIGVYFMGRRGNETGSFWTTLGGSLLGMFVMGVLYFYIMVAEEYMVLGVEKIVLWPLLFLAAPSMATVGFNLTRRYKEPLSSGTALTSSACQKDRGRCYE